MEEAWEMTPWRERLPEAIEERIRINPDLFQAPRFAWKKEWVVYGVFKSATDPVLAEIDIHWWQISTRTVHKEAPPGWKEMFGELAAGEHPYEIAAYLIVSKSGKGYEALKAKWKMLPTSEIV